MHAGRTPPLAIKIRARGEETIIVSAEISSILAHCASRRYKHASALVNGARREIDDPKSRERKKKTSSRFIDDGERIRAAASIAQVPWPLAVKASTLIVISLYL